MKIPKNNLIQTLLCQLLLAAAAFNFVSPAVYGLNASTKKYKSGEQVQNFPENSLPKNDSAKKTAVESLSKMPLVFEENRGQFEKQARFVSRNSKQTLFLTDAADAVLTFQSPNAEEKFSVLRMKLNGANKKPEVTGVEPDSAKVNYFRGDDPARWQSNVSTYRKVKYEEAYRGVDLFWYGNENNELEYDFVVKPNADYRQIEIKFDGAEKLEIDRRSGDLLIHMADGAVLRQPKPFTYQESDGERRKIESGYKFGGKNKIKFWVGGYDRSKNLVIDPLIIQYSSFLGGNDEDYGSDIAVDADGNVYIVGTTRSTNFPTTAGAVSNSKRSTFDTVFVSKFDATGTQLVYSTYLGGSSRSGEKGRAIAVDAAGSAYIVGETASSDFPTTLRAFERFKKWGDDDEDAFIAKLSADGSHLVYSTFLGGNDDEIANDIAVDTGGCAHVVGETGSYPLPLPQGTFPVTSGALPAPNHGGFYTKLNASGTDLEYSTLLSGNLSDEAQRVTVDAAGSAYVLGVTDSTNFPVVPGSFDTTLNGFYDLFVMKFSSNGALVYSTYLGGNSYDGTNGGFGLAVDRDGYCYVLASTGSNDFPTTPGALDRVRTDNETFVLKLSPEGSSLVFSTFLSPLNSGGSNDGNALAVDAQGRIFITGESGFDTFPQISCVYRRFVLQLTADGSALRNVNCYAQTFGENSSLAVDSKGSIYITGYTYLDSYPTTVNAYDRTRNGDDDVVFTRFKYVNNALDSDFDGDGKADFAVFRPSNGYWYLLNSQSGFSATQFGQDGDKLTPADFDGDGKTDIAVWGGARETSDPAFYILRSTDNTLKIELFGLSGDDPSIVGDYDGDGKADAAVYRAATTAGAQSYFYYRGSLNNPSGQVSSVPWGAAGDKSVSGDYNGDGKRDFAVYRAAHQKWYVLLNGEGANFLEAPFGLPTDKFVPKDYDGDGKTDLAVFRPSDGTWYIKQSTNNQVVAPQWGTETDALVPADYDGDGKIDIAVWRGGQWMIKRSSDGTPNLGTNFGLATDFPVQSAFVR